MMMIERFREATNQLHKEIEEENSASKIIDHSITVEEYKLLLLQNYVTYKVTEQEIGKFLSFDAQPKYRRLETDLKNLGVDTAVGSRYTAHFTCENYAEALGAAYVVEGSALGGMVISKELKECQNLDGLEAPEFFNGDRNNMKSWKAFKKQLDATNLSEEEAIAAVAKAQETFRFFGEIFREDLLEKANEQLPTEN